MKREPRLPFLLSIFATFFKIGAFTFGGGFAMIPLMEREVVECKGWLKEESFMDSIAITQSAPGAVAINMAIFLGQQLAGFPGAVAAAFGVALPSFLIILVIAVNMRYLENPLVESAFKGIRAAVVALLVYAGIKMFRSTNWSAMFIGILVLTLLAGGIFGVNAVLLILFAALLGLGYHYFGRKEMSSRYPAQNDKSV